jgi:hypothetical protein
MFHGKPNKEDLEMVIERSMEPLRGFLETDSNDVKGRNSYTTAFIDRLFDLYLLTEQNPSLKELSVYQNFLRSSVPLAAWATEDIIDLKIGIENLFTIDPTYNPWEEVCWRRSVLEAFKEMYQFTLGTDFQENYIDLTQSDYDTEDIDYLIEGYAIRDGSSAQSKIPAGIPRSHWWWWGKKEEAEAA